ncbi:MAG: hypothetical protein A3F54_00970 [Candidatus Kerfeldbacteria bacterium RIFCSPHIGHO2_12_FULL_48_17]|uniref:Uncharacterized protein n=1 Tax=Candidatus Kerfeldbacteria bacterium RIFCSPHIGHO2_12_FULL_48_17 TaxID=1798542 RepID=A0A1G2AZG6_9BACT|nr:MAG: hypothetical protein A3F54_00970 [Candidatus Kerfeldbacteria bacterium RIFCSPHIGHO2_12_FULL_48_17]
MARGESNAARKRDVGNDVGGAGKAANGAGSQAGQPEQINRKAKLKAVQPGSGGGSGASEQDIEIQLNSQRKADKDGGQAGESGATGGGGKVIPFRQRPGYVPIKGTVRFSGGGGSEGGGDAAAPKDFSIEESILDEDTGEGDDVAMPLPPPAPREAPTLDAAGQNQAASDLDEQRRFLQMQQREDEQGGGAAEQGGQEPRGGEQQGSQPSGGSEAQQQGSGTQAPAATGATAQPATVETPQQQSQAGTQLQSERKEAGAGGGTKKTKEEGGETKPEGEAGKGGDQLEKLKAKLDPVRLITDWILRWAVNYCASLEPFGILLLVAPYMNWHFLMRYWKDKKTHYRDMKIYEMLILGLIDIVWIGIVLSFVIIVYMGQGVLEGMGSIGEFFAHISPVFRLLDIFLDLSSYILTKI